MRQLVSPAHLHGGGRRRGSPTEVPPVPAHWVRREHLERRLTTAEQPLTIVTGAAGSGKTLLVAGWVRSLGLGRCRWMSLRDAVGAGRSPQRALADAAAEVWAGEGRVDLVVIDEIELLDGPAAAAQCQHLLRTVPAGMRVILVGRHHGMLGLGDVEQGAWAEVVGSELQFTAEETAELFRAHGCALAPGTARAAAEQNEGWAAGIRLAALRAATLGPDHQDERPVGDIRSLTAYFEREVLARETRGVATFLRELAVLPRMTAEVAEAVTGRPDAGELLERLAQEHVFVRSLGDGRYVLHRLFADALAHQLALEGATAVAEVRSRAARALELAMDDDAAARVLVASREYDRAFALRLRAVRRGLEWQPGGSGTAALPAGLPDRYLCDDPWRIYATCVALLEAEALDDAAMWLGRLDVAAVSPDAPPDLADRTHWLHALHATMLVDPDAALDHLSMAGPRRGAGPGLSDLECIDAAVHTMMRCVAARAQAWLGRSAVGSGTSGPPSAASMVALGPACRSTPAAVALAEGRLRDALELARPVLVAAREQGDGRGIDAVDCHLIAAAALYERNELEAATIELDQAGDICARAGLRRWAAVVRCEEARIAMARGRFDDALRLLDEARWPELYGAASPLVTRLADEVEIRCRLGMGDVTTAKRLFAAGPPALRGRELTARLDLAAGRPDAAMAALGGGGGEVPRRGAIERAVLRARCHGVRGDRQAAELALQAAIDLARGERFLRVFLDEPAQCTELLEHVTPPGPDAFLRALVGEHPRARRATLIVLEPLTSRERELLGFLPSHLSQHQIAREMYISANTVKTHMKGLYRKLGATSRSEAVDAARSCGLL